jgi:polyisoprenyl-phosphate glycosyltransferase
MVEKLISIVIPAYCEEKNIAYIYAELVRVIETLPHYAFEIIYVNDGSLDTTWKEIEKICEKDIRVK